MHHGTEKRKLLGMLMVVSLIAIATGPSSITGSVTGLFSYNNMNVFAIITFIGSLIGILTINEQKSFEEQYEILKEYIEQERKGELKSNYRYKKGLDKNEAVADDAAKSRSEIKGDGKWVLGNLSNRMDRLLSGLKSRKEHYYNLPTHSIDDTVDQRPGELKDFPDWGLFGYVPLVSAKDENNKPLRGMPQRKSKKVKLHVIHYTDGKGYEGIKNDKDYKLLSDRNGYTFFVDNKAQEGIKTKSLRRMLGIGNQKYVGNERPRDPTHFIEMDIYVPAERVMIKKELYKNNGQDVVLTKYAIAGGIKNEDIASNTISGGEYVHDGVLKNIKQRNYVPLNESWVVKKK